MNNKEAIIDKILSDANKKAEDILSTAKAKEKEILDKANDQVRNIFDQNVGKDQIIVNEILKRKAVVATLDNKKNLLAQKKRLVDIVFKEAINNFTTQKEYIDIISKMISSYCEDGDEVAICKNDKEKITVALIEKIAKKCNKKITLCKNFIDIKGGVVLVGKNFDKNLSLDVEFETLRGQIESEVVNILFEEKN